MAKMMTQLDLLTKNVMGGGRKNINVFSTTGDMPFDGVPYDIHYNEEVQYMGNQVICS